MTARCPFDSGRALCRSPLQASPLRAGIERAPNGFKWIPKWHPMACPERAGGNRPESSGGTANEPGTSNERQGCPKTVFLDSAFRPCPCFLRCFLRCFRSAPTENRHQDRNKNRNKKQAQKNARSPTRDRAWRICTAKGGERPSRRPQHRKSIPMRRRKRKVLRIVRASIDGPSRTA